MTVKVYYVEDLEMWAVVWGDRSQFKQYVNTETEALIMAEKIKFVEKVRDLVTQAGEVMDASPDVRALYFDRGYNSNGGNAITDADIESTGLTAAQIAAAITLFENLTAFFDNTNPSAALYRGTVNEVRNL